jgi:hypothetical protein
LNRVRAGKLAAIVVAVLVASSGTRALQVVDTYRNATAIDLTDAVEWLWTEKLPPQHPDCARATTGPHGPMQVLAREGSNAWVTFAVSNTSNQLLERLIVAPRCRSLGALLWPDLGKSHIAGITASAGDRPEREDSATADVFRVTLAPGSVTTFVVEMRTDDLPELLLWEPAAYHGDRPTPPSGQSPIVGFVALFALVISALTL